MFHRLKFSNFYSFLDEVEISFLMDGRSSKNEKSCDSSVVDCRVSKVMAVIGPNGAGKTNVIKPLAFLSWFASRSFGAARDDDIIIQPHFLNADSPSQFEIEFEASSRLFKYNLSIKNGEVEEELLSEKTSRLWSKLFERRLEGESYSIKQRGFGLDARIASKVKKNASLISTAAEHNIHTALIITEQLDKTASNISWFGRSNFRGFSDVIRVSSFYVENENYMKKMSELIKSWDFGIEDVKIQKIDSRSEDGTERLIHMPYGVHRYEGHSYHVPFASESSGTQAAYHLLSKLLPALERGGLVVYDELEGDLHPHMLDSITQLFFNPATNPKNAQIIFTTHSVQVLNELQKCQILLVEKQDGVSDAWRLSEVEGVRSDDNFYAKYMSGTYGAIPNI